MDAETQRKLAKLRAMTPAKGAFISAAADEMQTIVVECLKTLMTEGMDALPKIVASAAMAGFCAGASRAMESETSTDDNLIKFRSLLHAFQIEHEDTVRRIKELFSKEKNTGD